MANKCKGKDFSCFELAAFHDAHLWTLGVNISGKVSTEKLHKKWFLGKMTITWHLDRFNILRSILQVRMLSNGLWIRRTGKLPSGAFVFLKEIHRFVWLNCCLFREEALSLSQRLLDVRTLQFGFNTFNNRCNRLVWSSALGSKPIVLEQTIHISLRSTPMFLPSSHHRLFYQNVWKKREGEEENTSR